MFSTRRNLKKRSDSRGRGLLVLIETSDTIFAGKIGKILEQWGFILLQLRSEAEFELQEIDADVLLLDVRELAEDTFALLRSIRQRLPGLAVVLINRPDNVTASIAGMKAGAVNEIIAPFDTDTLKAIIIEAYELGQTGRRQKNKKPFLRRFSEVMMAATFAEAGEFESALDLLEAPAPRPTGEFATKKRKIRE